ncbi:hypothetical protein L1887_57774 [Cichorium endivia]|nr:hypothetical protein L1887_57774 [Cichorium endivia]
MPKSTSSSQDSHPSIPDSLPSLDGHDSLASSASSHSLHWHNPPDSRSTALAAEPSHSKIMDSSVSISNTPGPQRSTTIKASNKPAYSASTRTAAFASTMAPLHTMLDPNTSAASDRIIASSASPPLLHSLVFADRKPEPSSSAKSLAPSGVARDTYLALDEAAPRLSMSSTGSGSTCELATPENLHQSWPYDDVEGSALAALRASASTDPSQTAKAVTEHLRAIDLHATSPTDETPPATGQSNVSGLAPQRPARLQRLSSVATNATATNSTHSDESPQTATQSPRNADAHDLASFHVPSAADTSAYGLDRTSRAASSSSLSSPSLDIDIPSRASMTSPDSWRSLLPEHDPYFASEGQLRASHPQRSASPQSLRPFSATADPDPYVMAKTSPRAPVYDRMSNSSLDTTRTSFSSAISGYSTMSMAGASKPSLQSQDSARSDSWRSLLPDDDRYHTSRDAAGAHRGGLDASPNLASPSLSDHLDSPVSFDGHNPIDSAFFALDTRPGSASVPGDVDSATRRHAKYRVATSHTSIELVREASRCACQQPAPPRGGDTMEAPSMTPALSSSNTDDTSERDSWPTSRSSGGRDGLARASPVSSGPLTPEAGDALQQPSSLAAVLSQEAGGVAHVDSPAHVTETSESFVRATQDGLLATTTTTTTKTTMTTTTQFLADSQPAGKARSEAGGPDYAAPGYNEHVADGGEDDNVDDCPHLQSQPMKARTSSCSVSTPISPPSLPFLERRPAPPETDLVIETERSRYTLVTRLPGFSLDCITLATKQHKHHRTLHIVADKWDTEGGGHFERRITFPDRECDLKNVKAEFDGTTLRVYVPRKSAVNRFSSASSATF